MNFGLTADELTALGLLNHVTAWGEISRDPDIKHLLDDPKLIQDYVDMEALIRAVASMIEANNAAIYSSLKRLRSSNEQIITLAELLNNPVPNRNIEDFDDE